MGFGTSCSAIRILGGDSVWCPGEDVLDDPVGLAAAGIFSVMLALILLQYEDAGPALPPMTSFPLVKLRPLALSLAWLSVDPSSSSEGGVSMVLLLVAVQCLARICNKFLLISIGVNQRLPPVVMSLISLVLVFEAFACAYYAQAGLFLFCYLVLALLFEGDKEEEEESLTPLDAFFALLLLAVFFTSSHTTGLLAVLELVTWPVFNEHLALRRRGMVVSETSLAFATVLNREHLSLHALPVMCATALVNSCKASSLSLWVLVACLLSLPSPWLAGVVVVCLPVAVDLGPRAANRIHQCTNSLLRTGLVLFWGTCLAALPMALFPSSAFGLVAAFLLFSAMFEALQVVQGKIAQEWNGEQLGKEQLVLNSAALLVSSLACSTALVLASASSLVVALTICNTFALLSCLLGAAAYTAWFLQFGRGGAFRIIDEEGRELLSVTG